MNYLKILVLLLATADAVTAQVTNTVKVSALPSAGTITGSEIIPMVQSGATVSASVNQIIAQAQAATASASNTLAAAQAATVTTLGAWTNIIAANAGTNLINLQASNTVIRAAMTASNNVALAAINATNAAIQAALQASNAVYQAEIAAAGASGGSGGTLNVTNLVVTNIVSGAITTAVFSATSLIAGNAETPIYQISAPSGNISGVLVSNIDFSKGSFQVINAPINSGTPTSVMLLFTPINWHNGDNVWLLVKNTESTAAYCGSSTTATGGTIDAWGITANNGGYPVQMSGSVKSALLNWQVFGTQLIFTATAHP
jgi:hypothetical protein